jgi:hypothetical protein
MNRWAVRIAGLLLLLLFALVFAQLHRTLIMMQRQQGQQSQPGHVGP